jgi:hypothetical protein
MRIRLGHAAPFVPFLALVFAPFSALFFPQPFALIFLLPAQAGYGDKWPS